MKIYVFEVEPWEWRAFAALEADHDVEFLEEAVDRTRKGDFSSPDTHHMIGRAEFDAMKEGSC